MNGDSFGESKKNAGSGYSRVERVRNKTEIDRVFKTGARHSCRGMKVYVAANGLGVSRAVFVPVKAYPSAVARNRAKRLLREAWRLDKKDRSPGFDVAVVLYPGTDAFEERRSQLRRLLRTAGITGKVR